MADAHDKGRTNPFEIPFYRQPGSYEFSMTFIEYLTAKKIDATRFFAEDRVIYDEWSRLFDQMNPESFTVQKKFLLNSIRRKYLIR